MIQDGHIESVTPLGVARVAGLQGWPSCNPSFHTEQITPYVQVFVLLHGAQHFRVDDKTFHFDAGHGDRCRPVAGLFCVTRPSALTFLTETDTAMRKVRVSAPMSWITSLAGEQGARVPELARFFSQHLSHHAFEPPPHLVQLAEQILNPPPMLHGELLTLYRQSRGLEIMSDVCRALIDSEGKELARGTATAMRQSVSARDYILDNLRGPLKIEAIAFEAGTSPSALQRCFKEHYGVTVVEFIRQSRLEAAKDALEQGELTIAQAAHLAGYAHHSNFTTAFKRAYGVTPKMRRR